VPELDTWRTGISFVEPGRIVVRGYELPDLVGRATFGELVYLLVTGRYPTSKQGRMAEAVLVALADHGVHAPSVLATRIAASAGSPLQASVAAGIAAVGDHHGGALAGAMQMLEGIRSAGPHDATMRRAAELRVEEALRDGTRLPGFGHPYHRPDPRAQALHRVVNQLGCSGAATSALGLVTESLSASGRALMPNVDGAAAGVLLDIGVEATIGRGFFLVARCAGLVVHAIEEQQRERPFRTIAPEHVTYDGPDPKTRASPPCGANSH
jgi:citrate synthase